MNIIIAGNYSIPTDVNLTKLLILRGEFIDGISFDDSALLKVEREFSELRQKVSGQAKIEQARNRSKLPTDSKTTTYRTEITQSAPINYQLEPYIRNIPRYAPSDAYALPQPSENAITYTLRGSQIEALYDLLKNKCSADHLLTDLAECGQRCSPPCELSGLRFWLIGTNCAENLSSVPLPVLTGSATKSTKSTTVNSFILLTSS